MIINYLNEVGTGPLPPPVLPHTSPPQFLDTSGDGYVFPLDALLVINELNRGSDGEGETSDAGSAVPARAMSKIHRRVWCPHTRHNRSVVLVG